MKRIAITLLALLCLPLAHSQHKTPPDADKTKLWSSFAKFIVGDYVLVGKKPDSDSTYSGRVSLQWDGKQFAVTRTVAGQTVHGTGFFEVEPGCCDYNTVLRMRFPFDGQSYEATFLWSGDLSNYARLTGYVYLMKPGATKSPGLEVLFPLGALTEP
jgi:hypothetical protein